MAYNKTNYYLMNRTEVVDYQKAKNIISTIFGDKLIDIKPTNRGESVDLRFTASTKTHTSTYAVEIKSNNGSCIERDQSLPLLLSKYLYMRASRKEGEKLILLFLINDGRYYIFDVDKYLSKPMSEVSLSMWKVAKENYTTRERNEYISQPRINFNIDEALMVGRCEAEKVPIEV